MTDQGFILQFYDTVSLGIAAPDRVRPPSSRRNATAAISSTMKRETSRVIERTKTSMYDNGDEIYTRLQFLEGHIRQLESVRFRQVWINICQLADTQLQIVQQLLRVDATLAVRLWLKRTDIAARVAGEALLVWPCRKRTADFVFWGYNVGTDCYALLPVVINETMYFVLPGSRDLVTSSPKIPCYEAPVGVHYDNHSHTWTSIKGPIEVKPLLQNLTATFSDDDPFVIDAPLTLQDNNQPPFQGSLEIALLETWRLRQQLHNLVNFTSGLHIDPSSFRRVIHDIGDGARDVNDLSIFQLKQTVKGVFS